MGQNSSQPVESEEQSKPVDSVPRGKKRKLKKSKRKSTELMANDITEEDSARALMQMRDEHVNHVRRDSVEYDMAASSQLTSDENTPSQMLDLFEEEDTGKKPKRKRNDQGDKKKRKRQKSHGSSALQEDGNSNLQPQGENNESLATDDFGELHFWLEDYAVLDLEANFGFAEVNDVPPSTLDQIPSDDEDIASFLRDFQEQGGERCSRPLDSVAQLEEEHDEVLRSSMPLSSPISHRKKKRAQVSDFGLLPSISPASAIPQGDQFEETSSAYTRTLEAGEANSGLQQHYLDLNVEGNNDLLSGTGQHTLDPDSSIDFEAFDDFCAAYGLGSADVFDDPSEQSPVINAGSKAARVTPTHARQNTVADSEGNATSHQRKSRRRASRSSRQERMPTEDALVSDTLSREPYLLNDEQSDHVLLGLEDLQRLSSQEFIPRGVSPPRSIYSSDLGESNIASPTREKAKRRSSKSSRLREDSKAASPEEESRTEGKFTGAEISKLEKFRDSYCADKNISTWQFNDLIQATVRERPMAKEMWQDMYEILPYRKKTPIQRFCRRRFHNYEVRGAWTEEDDRALARAVQEKGNSWVAVGHIMERHPEDVRDRWRNYHVNSENRNREHWTDEEIRNLIMAVHECIRIMRDARRSAKLAKYEGRDVPESEAESDQDAADAKLVNWQVVSDRMGGSRSRLQCSFKWGKLKNDARVEALKHIEAAQKGLQAPEQEPARVKKNPWRQRRAERRVQEMRPGDVYDFLHAVSTCQAAHEDNIPWKSLGDKDFRDRWTTADRKAAWAMFKGSVLGAEGFYYQEIVNHLLNNLLANEGDKLDERWDPEIHGYGQAPPRQTVIQRRPEEKEKSRKSKLQRQKEKRKRKVAALGPKDYRNKVKSSLYVAATDDEDDERDAGNHDENASITRSSNESRRSSNESGLSVTGNLNQYASQEAAETEDTTVDESGDDHSINQRFNNNLASQLKQSLA